MTIPAHQWNLYWIPRDTSFSESKTRAGKRTSVSDFQNAQKPLISVCFLPHQPYNEAVLLIPSHRRSTTRLHQVGFRNQRHHESLSYLSFIDVRKLSSTPPLTKMMAYHHTFPPAPRKTIPSKKAKPSRLVYQGALPAPKQTPFLRRARSRRIY